MKAIVMAGGEGTRLRPLTEGRPKPMVELLGAPILERTVEHLKNNGVTELCFTLRYLPQVVEDYFGDGERFGVRISYSVETEPLGTAGGVRACREFIGDEPVLIISGDGVCNFDLRLCGEFFEKKSADAVIVLFEHPEPTRFGLVLTDPDGRVAAFSEKPAWDKVVTSMVNTGIYILSPRTVDMIPSGVPYDFGKDLFPRLLREGKRLFAVPAGTYWCDVGSPEAYRQCCVDIVSGRVGLDLKAPELEPGVYSRVPLAGVSVTPPVFVGEGCAIERGAVLGPGAVLSNHSRVGKGAAVRDSVINGACVGEGCVVEGAIVGRDARIGDGARLGRECVVGDGAQIGALCVLAPGVRVWTDRKVPGGRRLARSLTGETPAETAKFVSDWRLTGDIAASLTPETALAIGAVLGKDGRIGVACAGGQGARLLSDAILCGVTASGGECCRLDAGFEAQLAGVARLFALDGAVFVRESGEDVAMTFFTGAGTPIGTEKRVKLQSALTGDRPRTAPKIGGVSSVTGVARAYISGVIEEVRTVVSDNAPVTVAVSGADPENRALRCALAGLGFTVGRARRGCASFKVLPGGFDLLASDERGREADARHTTALAAQAIMRLGADRIGLPPDAPAAVGRMCTRYGCRPFSTDTPTGAELWEKQRWLRDGAVKAALIASLMARDSAELARLADDIPTFAVEERRVELPGSKAKLMRLLAEASAETASEIAGGLRIGTSRGEVRIAPTFDGGALRLTAEAGNAETAEELCLKAEKLAREVSAKAEK